MYTAAEDIRKEKVEEALKIKEVNEKEEAKRKHIDALAQKARKDYLKSEQSKKKLARPVKMNSKQPVPKVTKAGSHG